MISKTSRALAIGMLLTACGEAPAPSYQVRDSAGVPIAENTAPSGPTLVLDSVPVFDIGPASGSDAEFISHVTAARLPNGQIIANGWAMKEIKLFDSAGRWLRTVGRQGGGPGEFEALGFVFSDDAGTLVTYEPFAQRIQRWTDNAEITSLTLLTSPPGRPTAWVEGVAEGGGLVVRTSVPGAGPVTDISLRNVVSVFLVPPDGGTWDSLFAYQGPTIIHRPGNPGWQLGPALFEPQPVIRARRSHIIYAPGDRFEIEIRDAGGKLRRIVRRATEPRPITTAEFDRAFDARIEATSERFRAEFAPWLRKASTGRIRPPLSGAWITESGGLWATHGDPALGEPVRASVFDSTGRWLSDLTIPADVRILQADSDGMLGTIIDDDGFHHLRFYRIRREADGR